MVQETYDTHPSIRDACDRSISGHAAKIEADIDEAMRERRIKADWSAESLALHTQAVLQGAFILAKAKGDPKAAADSIDHLHRYVELLFKQDIKQYVDHVCSRNRAEDRPRICSSNFPCRSAFALVCLLYSTPIKSIISERC